MFIYCILCFCFSTVNTDIIPSEINLSPLSPKPYRLWREDKGGCKGDRAILYGKLFSKKSQQKYKGLSRDSMLKLFGKTEVFKGLNCKDDCLIYHMGCQKIYVLVISFQNDKFNKWSIIIE